MRVVVVGVGAVGWRVAAQLSLRHEVVVVDVDESVLSELSEFADVDVVVGDGSRPSVLVSAGVGRADYLVAATHDDTTNIVICVVGKSLAPGVRTVARVKSIDYFMMWGRGGRVAGIDLMVTATPLVARAVADVIEYPGLRSLTELVRDVVIGEAVEEPSKHGRVWVGEVAGRRVVIGARREVLAAFRRSRPRRAVLVGASPTNKILAPILAKRGLRTYIIEPDRARAEEVAKEVSDAVVLVGNPFDEVFWRRERLAEGSAVITSLGSDDSTLYASLLAKHLGASRVFAIAHRGSSIPIYEEAGVIAYSPEEMVAEKIIVSLKGSDIVGTAGTIPGIQAIAVRVHPGTALAGKTPSQLPYLVPAIIRGGELLITTPETRIEPGDTAIILTQKESLGELEI